MHIFRFYSLISLLLFIHYVYSQTPEGCNYASTDDHIYPIGACDKTKTSEVDGNLSYSSFKFVCEAGYVFKYEYDTDEYCHGTPISSTNFTDQLEDFECNEALCDWSQTCTYTGCYNSTSQTCDCSRSNDESHCIPILTDQCITNSDGNLTYAECDNTVWPSELITDYFSSANCTDDSSIFNTIITGGSDAATNCRDEKYYTTECWIHSIPTCNYAADDNTYYPINACDTTKSTTDNIVTYSAFKYICDNAGDVYKYEYNTSDYCNGTHISMNKVNAELTHYECNLNACKFADLCSLTLNECDTNGCDYDSTCVPRIVDNCMGFSGGQLFFDTCVNDTLTEGTYFGVDCDPLYLFFTDVYSGYDDLECGAESFSKVKCIDPDISDANSIIYHTTECTQVPTESPTMEPTNNPTSLPTMEPSFTTNNPTESPTKPTNNPTMEPTFTTEESVECTDVIWKILIRFRVKFLVLASEYKDLMEKLCKESFIDAILFLDEWNSDWCVDVSGFNIMPYESDNGRRLLQNDGTEYEIEIEFEYNDELQDAVFDNDEYNTNSFSEQFGSSVENKFESDNLIESGSVNGLQVMEPERINDESGHKVEGALINAVSIFSIFDVLLFIGCMIYVYAIMKKRLVEKGHGSITFVQFINRLTWKEYSVCCVEVVTTIIRWIFTIDVIVVGKTYLGYIGIMILILGNIVLILRYILYKKLCIEHVNDIMGNVSGNINDNGNKEDAIERVRRNDMIDEVRFRKVDLGMIGLLLMSIEDIPIVILMLIIGENWDYHAIIVLCFIFSIVSIIMKIILLIVAKYGPIKSTGYQSYVKTKEAIELGQEKKEKDNKKDDKNEEEAIANIFNENDKTDDKKEEETDVVKSDNDKNGGDKTDDKKTDSGDKKTDGSKKTDDGGDNTTVKVDKDEEFHD